MPLVGERMLASVVLSLAQTGQLSPGSSAAHWTTRTFICSAAAAGVVWLLAFLGWKKLIAGVRDRLFIRILVYSTEAAAAIALSVIASYFDIFKKSTYVPTDIYRPDWHIIFWACVWASIVALYLVVKLCGISTKEGEDFRSKQLAVDLEKERTARTTLEGQRGSLIKITSFARQLVAKKIERLCVLQNRHRITIDEFVAHLNPSLQIQLMMKLIHEFFKTPGSDPTKLRLGLWMKHSVDGEVDRLIPSYSWNGERENCFSDKSSDRMKLVDPQGTRSEIVRCYQALPRTIKIVPNCTKAAQAGEFDFFYPEQRDKLGSMVLYKHVFSEQAEPVAVVLLLVSSQEDHFAQQDSEEIKQFLDESLTRIEMELIVLGLTRKIHVERSAEAP